MFKPKDYAFQIETTVKAVFKCGEYELVSIYDSRFIEQQPFVSMAFVLGNFYNRAGSRHKAEIDEFFHKNSLIMNKSISEIGEENMENIIQDFKNIVSTV
ncbi:MAG: hypothetical protein GX968_02115 [Tissierellia bacterium]|nr:hypothetical protein [Tissierellia bacterium]